jgi:hypothetical protein
MNLRILGIEERGKQNAEYVVLYADLACDLTDFMIADTTFAGTIYISNKLRNTHWFKPRTIPAGDYVFLRTGVGTDHTHANIAGTTTHVIYWGLNKPVWNNTGDAAVLIEMAAWKTTRT